MKRVFSKLWPGVLCCIMISCHSSERKNDGQPDDQVPVLSPEASLSKMRVEKGFTVKLVAAEPLVNTPVAMAFDDSLRIWVVEMSDYQPINEGDAEQLQTGKIVILEDKDGDGKMDVRKVFMDSLVAPRAICLVDNGILVATPPELWYVEINNDRPGKKILIDSAYTVSGNPEGQTNGLLRSLDNWIYSAGFGSNKRYRKINGHWRIEKTFLRGQWGVSQDDYGRLFYNNNSKNLLGDYFMPGLGSGNNSQKKVAGYNEKIVSDNRVYPERPTPGVNRGYKDGILDDRLHLVNFTAACGPVIYRGGLFGKAYQGNAFVCEPAANLVKRNILWENGYEISGKQAYEGKEFLASTDERFRPVSLYNGPDGALYLVDMYRGIIQDDLSLTDYLKKYVMDHKLNNPVNCGRIYKIVPKGATTKNIIFPDDPDKLVGLLKNSNGWVRDKAQQKLIDGQYRQAIGDLRKLLQQKDHPLAMIHALWTLEGLHALKSTDIIPLLNSPDRHIRIQAISALIAVINQADYKKYLPVMRQLILQKDSLVAPYIAYAANSLKPYATPESDKLLDILIREYANNKYVTDAVISGLQGRERKFLNKFHDTTTIFHQQLERIVKDKMVKARNKSIKKLKDKYPEGYAIFNMICQTCHGGDGNGIQYLAPPLKGSDWVMGDKYKPIAIVLYGLTGSVNVHGKTYKAPEITGEMPGFGNNNQFSDKAIAELLSFIRNAWGNKAADVHENDVQKIRRQFKNREKAFTADELKKTFSDDK